jgi:hypothetical protein
VCRCGSERRRLEALGYKFDSAPPPPPKAASRPRQQSTGLAGALIGYQLDTDLGAAWRATLKVLFAILVLSAGYALVRYTHHEPVAVRENVEVLTTLDGFTRNAAPDSPDTIPMFITSAGRLGVLSATGEPSDPVKAIPESDLRLGFCSRSVVRQVRHEFPGYYENWPDDKLERTVLEKYPEYADRVCVLSVRFDATASDIVKYDVKPRSLLGNALLWSRTIALTLVFAVLCLNVYYRLIIGRLASPAAA